MGTIADLFRQYEASGAVRLGIGERTDAAGELPRLKARDAFMRALYDDAREEVDELLTPPMITGAVWFHWLVRAAHNEDDPGPAAALSDDEFERRLRHDAKPFTDGLRDWAERHGLLTPWVTAALADWLIDAGVAFLARSQGDEPKPRDLLRGLPEFTIKQALDELVRAPGPRLLFAGMEYGDPTSWPLDVFPPDPETGEDGTMWFEWNPALESRADNERRAVAYFRQMYRAAQDARLREAGDRFPTRTQTRRYDHFRWLVQYQVLEWSYSRVAREAIKERQTVTDAIKDTAALIDLPLRE